MRAPAALLLLAACSSGGAPAEPAVQLSLAQDAVHAGGSVAFELRVGGRPAADQALRFTLESSREPEVVYSARELYPRLAGTHDLIAVLDDGRSATAQLRVAPGPASSLRLELEPPAVPAGAPARWTVSGEDALGNAIDGAAATLVLPPELRQEGPALATAAAGSFEVIARLDTAQATARLEVEPGAATALDLEVTQHGTTLSTEAELQDAHGNRVPGAVDLSVDCDPPPPSAPAVRVGPDLYFLHEGRCWVEADHDALHAEAGPFAIDWTPPAITLHSPHQGAWLSLGAHALESEVEDHIAGVASVTVSHNDHPAPAAPEEGRWKLSVEPDFGMLRMETVATDAVGNSARAFRTVVVGDQLPIGDPDPAGIIVQLHDSPTGLQALAGIAAAEVESTDLAPALPEPLVRKSAGPNSLEVAVRSVRPDSTSVSFVPQAPDQLLTLVELKDVELDWEASGSSLGIGFDSSGTGSLRSLELELTVQLSVVDAAFAAEVTVDSVQLTDLDLGLSGKARTAATALGLNPTAAAESALEDNAGPLLAPAIAAAIEQSLAELSLDTGWSSGPSLIARPARITVDSSGVRAELATLVTVPAPWDASSLPGSLVQAYRAPGLSLPEGGELAVSLNALNQMIHANWAVGALDLVGTDEDFDIDMTLFAATLPGISSLVGQLEATYPPFALPDGEGGLTLELAELRLDLYDGDIVEGAAVYTIFLTISAPVEIVLEDGLMDIDWGQQQTWMQVAHAPPGADLFFLELLLESLSGSVVLNRYGLLEVLPLPRIGGYTLDATELAPDRDADGGYLVAPGDFRAE